MQTVTLRCLGRLGIQSSPEETIAPMTRKLRALFVYLVLSNDEGTSREKLAMLLWPDNELPQARANLRQALSGLRRSLHDESSQLIWATKEKIGIDTGNIDCDVCAFQELAQSKDSAARIRAARQYGGDFLDGFTLANTGFDA